MNLKFSLIQASYWMTFCVMFTYLVPLYESFGYGELLSGVISMIGTAVLAAAQPLWGVLCDRAKRIKPILVTVLLAGAGASLLLPLGRNSVAVTITAVVLLVATTQSLMYLFDTWAARLQSEGARLHFGLTRSCGSLFYALTAVFFGMALDRFGFSIMTPVFIALSLCVAAAVLAVKEPPRDNGREPAEAEAAEGDTVIRAPFAEGDFAEAANAASGFPSPYAEPARGSIGTAAAAANAASAQPPRAVGAHGSVDTAGVASETAPDARPDFWPAVKRLMTDRRYLCLLAAVFLTFFGSSGIMLFFPLRVAEIGGGNSEYGLALFVMAASEVPALLLYRRLSLRFSNRTLLAASLLFITAKVAAIALSPELWLVVVLMTLQGPSYGIYLSAIVRYVPEIVEPRLTYTAQTVIAAVVSGAAGVASNLYMGVASERFGLQTAMITLIFITFCGFLVFAAPELARRKGGKKHDQPDFQL